VVITEMIHNMAEAGNGSLVFFAVTREKHKTCVKTICQ